MCLALLFFFKHKTAYEMRISDWSSDVCSSDLEPGNPLLETEADGGRQRAVEDADGARRAAEQYRLGQSPMDGDFEPLDGTGGVQVGRAAGRERVCQHV